MGRIWINAVAEMLSCLLCRACLTRLIIVFVNEIRGAYRAHASGDTGEQPVGRARSETPDRVDDHVDAMPKDVEDCF